MKLKHIIITISILFLIGCKYETKYVSKDKLDICDKETVKEYNKHVNAYGYIGPQLCWFKGWIVIGKNPYVKHHNGNSLVVKSENVEIYTVNVNRSVFEYYQKGDIIK